MNHLNNVKLNPSAGEKSGAGKEVTRAEILTALGNICPPGSFRMRASESGVLDRGRREIVAGRKTIFYPPDSIEIMRSHIMARKAGGDHGKP